ncbi:MAG: TolC family protein [Bacteroidetes bacterium]|nr:TolC family protein [Bacteroidota bacterium]
MKTIIWLLLIFLQLNLIAQEKPKLILEQLIDEALNNNLELQAFSETVKASEAKIPQMRSLDDPELTFRLMEMPGLKPNEAMNANIELMQMVRFPTKISTEARIAELEANRAQQLYNEKSVEIIMKAKSAFYELWMAQQSLELNRVNSELMKQFLQIAQTRYAVGKISQQDVLRAQVEIAKLEKERLGFSEMEEAALAMLASLLNKNISDFTGTATAPDTIFFDLDIKQIQVYALKNCSKLRSDSLMVEKDKAMHKLATLEYLPDFKVGVEYVSSPITGFRGWSLLAGVSLPFSFWTLGKANARVEEASANILKSTAMYKDERNMLLSKVREYFAKSNSLKSQWELYQNNIIPLAERTLQVTLTNYQTGQTDFLMLLDAYRMLVMEKMEQIMTRMKFEQTLADLEKEIGCRDIEEVLK